MEEEPVTNGSEITGYEILPTRTIFEPFAWGIFHGCKWYETSAINTKIRGRVYIHAGLHTPPWMLEQFFRNLPREYAKRFTPEWVAGLPRGVILGSVEIVDSVRAETVRGEIPALEYAFGDWRPGRYAWKLANPILFPEPVPAVGKQGWWKWGEDKHAL